MTDTKSGNTLLKAAKTGDAKKIRELLSSGAPIEALDLNRFTPVMLAAQAGQAEAFHTLVESGANLQVLGLNQTDLLECAAEGGNVEIVRFLIDQGHPIEGHWKPRSKVGERMGHITPLIMAAINARVEVVRVLLEAGANREAKFDGQTALKLIQTDIKYPNGDEEVKRVPQLKQIAVLLKGDSVNSKSSDDSWTKEIEKFAQNVRKPVYQRLQKLLTERCGAPQVWKPLADHGIPAKEVVRFTIVGCKQQKEIEELHEEARKADCHLVFVDAWAPGEDANLVLFPTDNKLAVIAAIGTEGTNYSVQTSDIIAWVKQIEEETPFNLVFCSHDLLGGEFLGAIKGVKKLVTSLIEVCPSCLDEGLETAEELARVLKKQRTFLLRWD